MRDIDDDLQQWAIWSRSGAGPRLTYPHKAAFTIHTSKGYTISDELAQIIDLAVASLQLPYPKEHEAICLVYLEKLKYWQGAEKMRCHSRTFAQYVEGGRRFIDGAVCGRFIT